MSLLRAVPCGMFSPDFTVLCRGRRLTTISTAWLGEAGEFRMRGQDYRLGRSGLPAWSFFLNIGEWRLATAERADVFADSMHLACGDVRYELAPGGSGARHLSLRCRGREVGRVRTTHPLARQAEAEFTDGVGLPEQVFVLWLALLAWRGPGAAVPHA